MAVLSIRHKVIMSVAAIYVFMGLSAFGAYYFVLMLEDKIGYLEDVSKLEEAVLEMRRFEKNCFLYRDGVSLKAALYHLNRARRLFETNFDKIVALSSAEKAHLFRSNLQEYESLMSLCQDAACNKSSGSSGDNRPECEAQTRKLGASLVDFAESVIRQKRNSIREMLRSTVQLQLAAFAIVAIGLMTTGIFLFTKVLKPLRRLEENTERIAQGFFEPINDLPPEREVREIFESFNRMARELRTRENQLLESKKLASLGTMLAGVAHEVNNPLSNISSSCEILLEELEQPDKDWQRGLLKKVLEQVDKAKGIVRDLLEFSRSKEFLLEPLNLKDVLTKTVALCRCCRGHLPPGVEIRMDIDANLTVLADTHRIQQAFMNLISNAIQAVGDEGLVKIAAYDNRNGMVTVVIRDSGHGIEKDALPQIFDPFFTTKDVGQGTGLGLFITHDIIVRHGGSIKVESTVGKGTTFMIKIPREEQRA